MKKVLKILGLSAATLLTAAVIFSAWAAIYAKTVLLPKTDISLSQFSPKQTTVVVSLDAEGNEVEQARISSGGESTWVDFEDMPEYLKKAAIAIEDERFYSHGGVDLKRTVKGVINLVSGDAGGGSTITQQLVKNLVGNSEYSIKRKLEEMCYAINLEKNNGKDEILEYYLNTIYLANGCRGVEAAANRYLDKSAAELTLAEAAAIVGITKYPNFYDPLTHAENNAERRTTILWKMWQLGMISEGEYRSASAEEIRFVDNKANVPVDATFSYFTDYVFGCVVKDLCKKYGYSEGEAKSLVANGGLKIVTTMDAEVQNAVDAVCVAANFGGEEPLQAAVTVVENGTGRIVAICGGTGEKTESLSLNRAADVYRQPGSVIKPLSVYAPALEAGLITEATVYDDVPVDVENKWPRNYDSEYSGYGGLTSVASAVANSTNTVAVNVLKKLGVDTSFDWLKNKFCLSQVTADYNGKTDIALSPLALGGLTVGTNTTELAAAYSAFASNGVYTAPYAYYRVLDARGNVLLENLPEQCGVMTAQTAYIMTDMLMQTVSEGTGKGAAVSGVQTAGKTGTTTGSKDRWFVGYTPYYSCAVWVGYDTPKEVTESGNPALKMWKSIMEKAHKGLESKDFAVPDGVVECEYCADCGKAPTALCKNDLRGSRVRKGVFLSGTEPAGVCTTHMLVKICTESGCVACEECPLESVEYRPMLRVFRQFPYELTVKDAQYTYVPLPYGYEMPKSGLVYANLLGKGMYAPVSLSKTQVNNVCTVHGKEQDVYE